MQHPRTSTRLGGLVGLVAASTVALSLVVPGAAAAACGTDPGFGGGDGTSGAPYQIATAAHLALLSSESGVWSCDFVQTADIDLDAPAPGAGNHNPIGDTGTPFGGTYDGAGHSISGLTIVGSGNGGLGLFGVASGATIRDLTLVDPSVTGIYDGDTFTGDERIGALAGSAEASTILDIIVTGARIVGSDEAGGLIGRATELTELSRIEVDATVTEAEPETGNELGGVIGIFYSSGTDVYTMTDIEVDAVVEGSSELGGLIGDSAASIAYENVVVRASVTGDSYGVGLLIGYNDPGDTPTTVTKVLLMGDISGSGEVGGVVGVVDSIELDTVVLDADIVGLSDSSTGCYAGSSDDLDDANVVETAVFHSGTVTKGQNPAEPCGPAAPTVTVTAPSFEVNVGEPIPDIAGALAVYDENGEPVEFAVPPVCTTDDGSGDPVTTDTPPGTYEVVCEGGVVWGALVASFVAGTITVVDPSATTTTEAPAGPSTTDAAATTTPSGVLPPTGADADPALLALTFLALGGGLVALARRRLA